MKVENKNHSSKIDDKTSVWVSASAGTGKTTILVQRILYLLLSGSKVDRILCLTFTRTAAAEMKERINFYLSQWAILDEEELSIAVEKITGKLPGKDMLGIASNLFFNLLQTPDGIRIETIHGFCQSVLRRFPIESGIPPQFRVADEQQRTDLIFNTRLKMMIYSRANPESELSVALKKIMSTTSETNFHDHLLLLIREKSKLENFKKIYENTYSQNKIISKFLGIDSEDTEDSASQIFSDYNSFSSDKLEACAKVFIEGNKTESKWGKSALLWLSSTEEERASNAIDYAKGFFTSSGNLRSHLPSQKLCKKAPQATDFFHLERDRAQYFLENIRSIRLFERTNSWITISKYFLELYEEEKSLVNTLDFDDLIHTTHKLLSNPNLPSWVLFKMDGGIDHILVDESQDTSSQQWSIIKALSDEYFSTRSSDSRSRSLFIVGDEKQSIFSFQGADPYVMEDLQKQLSKRAQQANIPWTNLPLNLSFRSTSPILSLVDATFSDEETSTGVAIINKKISHNVSRLGDSGLVEIWDTEKPVGKPPSLDLWSLPTSREQPDNPKSRLAKRIAETISSWVSDDNQKNSDYWLSARNRKIQAGDIMILVQQRDSLMEYLIKALKKENVPVTGIDRMVLIEQLPVMDLMALGDFLLFPKDDLMLATILKGPFIGLSEEHLFNLAYNRGPLSLWEILLEKQHEDPIIKQCVQLIKELMNKYNKMTPYDFYSDFLLSENGRRALIDRLGEEINDPVDQFLNLALEFQNDQPLSLQTFLAWLRSGRNEVKRNMERNEGAVKILTTHSAKGLQAPIVFLADAARKPSHRPTLVWSHSDEINLPIWLGKRSEDTKVVGRLREHHAKRQDEEYRRLLYVGMTRAEDRLYVCGTEGVRGKSKNCWHEIVMRGFDILKTKEKLIEKNGLVRFSCPQKTKINLESNNPDIIESEDSGKAIKFSPLYTEDTSDRLSITSKERPSNTKNNVSSRKNQESKILIGKITHRLLEILLTLPVSDRFEAGEKWLSNGSHGLDKDKQKKILFSIKELLNNQDLKKIFGPLGRSEVPFSVEVNNNNNNNIIISGKIDRLLIEDDIITAIDFKTDKYPPDNQNLVRQEYIEQMQDYAKALRIIFPGKKILCGLLFTTNASMIWIDVVS